MGLKCLVIITLINYEKSQIVRWVELNTTYSTPLQEVFILNIHKAYKMRNEHEHSFLKLGISQNVLPIQNLVQGLDVTEGWDATLPQRDKILFKLYISQNFYNPRYMVHLRHTGILFFHLYYRAWRQTDVRTERRSIDSKCHKMLFVQRDLGLITVRL